MDGIGGFHEVSQNGRDTEEVVDGTGGFHEVSQGVVVYEGVIIGVIISQLFDPEVISVPESHVAVFGRGAAEVVDCDCCRAVTSS